MTLPYDFLPFFTEDDILEPPSENFKEGRKASTIGWLQKMFLEGNTKYSQLFKESNHIEYNVARQKEYESIVDKFKSVNSIGQNVDLLDWEDKTSAKKQAEALNKLVKELGYEAAP